MSLTTYRPGRASGRRIDPQRATGTVAGQTGTFLAPHRDGNPSVASTTVTLAFPMSHEDIEAAFWLVLDGGVELAELADPDAADEYLFDTVLALGTAVIDKQRRALTRLRPGSSDHTHYLVLRDHVAQLYGPRPTRGGRR